ncbi:hypothetical protein UPYG_G00239480 [Umbra pygmaea]|uniref:Ig-like domain-containing protein n=1 Tax=Umbra pygmaea TaxID=75934 RepID=A0ABD0WJU2_UMBPY
MLTRHLFLFYITLVCAFSKADVIQPNPMIVTRLGDTVTLICFCPNKAMNRYDCFIKDFTETKRLSVKRGEDSYNLTISQAEPEDSATYYCSTSDIFEDQFGEGTVLIVEGSEYNTMYVVQQPVSESVQPGDSETLNCTIHTETCVGEHSVYWFRHGSGQSHPEIIYTNGGRSGQCKKSPEAGSPTQSCVYNLTKRNLRLSDAGTYYCAVASCGEILFGNGTKLDVIDSCGDQTNLMLLIVICFLTTGLILSVIANGTLCMRLKKVHCEHCTAENASRQSLHGNTTISQDQLHDDDDDDDDDTLNYVALKITDRKSTKSRRMSREQREDGTIYSGLSYKYIHTRRDRENKMIFQFSIVLVLLIKDFKMDNCDILGSSKTVVQQPVSESVQPGDSVTLNCTIHTETCAGEHSVYWFRHGSGQSHPGMIYTNGDRSGQCKKSPEAGSPTQSCVYNLPKRNLSLSDAGTYYCAVASCGEILFGNGTRLDVGGKCNF